jgi:hypothetical protein
MKAFVMMQLLEETVYGSFFYQLEIRPRIRVQVVILDV